MGTVSWNKDHYSKYRPGYPPELYSAILEFGGPVLGRDLAVDVGCGSGQVGRDLASYFHKVIGIDPSATQLAAAAQAPNIEYRLGTSEDIDLPASSVDVVTAAAALHWFDQAKFYAEARRILRPGGVLAAWCYTGLVRFDPGHEEAQMCFERVEDKFMPYFDPRLQAVLQNMKGYEGLEPSATDFATVARRFLSMRWEVSVEHLQGLVKSWSGYVAMVEDKGQEATDAVVAQFGIDLASALGVADAQQKFEVTVPLEVILAKDPCPVS